ncbi:MAG: proline dehydrogenase family protein [Candidatus Nanopelagicales bacterium]
MIRRALLSLSRQKKIQEISASAPIARSVVMRFIAGETEADAVRAAGELAEEGLLSTIDHLGEDILDRGQADYTRDAYVRLLKGLDEAGLAAAAEVSVKLSAMGQALPGDGEKIALENARVVCETAKAAGTTVTLDMEDHTTTDSTLGILRQLRADFPDTGAVLQAYLYRTEQDCRDLAHEGSRIRLCKGAYKEPESVAFQAKEDVDKAYVRCMRILFDSKCYPMIASHDPRLVEIAGALATRADRAKGTYEHQMLYGVRPDEQRRLAKSGERMRVYIPYGAEWYGYMVRRMAEKPANMTLFLKSLTSKS